MMYLCVIEVCLRSDFKFKFKYFFLIEIGTGNFNLNIFDDLFLPGTSTAIFKVKMYRNT